ncbi:hypothetical protein VTL71DRAFT_7550, partial [Oculimacula yallundae]
MTTEPKELEGTGIIRGVVIGSITASPISARERPQCFRCPTTYRRYLHTFARLVEEAHAAKKTLWLIDFLFPPSESYTFRVGARR